MRDVVGQVQQIFAQQQKAQAEKTPPPQKQP